MPNNQTLFSGDLEKWLKGDQPKTLQALADEFGAKSFAVFFIVLMFIPALPIPTGGITHLFLEPITILLALELIIGFKAIWIPNSLKKVSLAKVTNGKAILYMIRRVKNLERFSSPRMHQVVKHPWFGRMAGVIVLAFTLAAFAAPPFSGLDTLPAMGVVIISLSIILEDIVLWFAGLFVGLTGIAIELTLAGGIIHFVGKLL